MAEGRYYWLKLKKDFFKRHDITIIEGMPNGKDYILFYLKLLCESTDHEGKLRFSDEIPYNEEMLASITRTNIDVVRSAVKIFTELKMMEVFDDGTLYMSEVNKMLGSETKWAEKKRAYRENQKLLEQGQCPNNEDNVLSMSDKSKSKSKSKSKNKNKIYSPAEPNDEPDSFSENCKEIIAYLNETCGTAYRASSKATQRVIHARLNEGFTVEDFKTVIYKKAKQWKDDPKMCAYLRPQTLFGTKFEGYLNEKEALNAMERWDSA